MAGSRGSGRTDTLRRGRDRTRIAQAAARLIAEHGITDWTLAKRKAARQLMLPETTGLPSNDEIEAALADHHALFGGDAHLAALRRQRVEALGWMRRLARWEPLLVGGVAEGWASEHSDVRLELVADDPKSVEIALAGEGIAYAALPQRADDTAAHLRIDSRWTPEAGAVSFLNGQPEGRRVLIWFDWGGYALWHLSPRMRISMDGRRETVYSPDLQDRHLRFYFDAPGGASLPTDLGADYVWIPRTLPAVHRLDADGWRRIYQGRQSVIFGRATLPETNARVVLAADSGARFFPGP